MQRMCKMWRRENQLRTVQMKDNGSWMREVMVEMKIYN